MQLAKSRVIIPRRDPVANTTMDAEAGAAVGGKQASQHGRALQGASFNHTVITFGPEHIPVSSGKNI